MIAGNFPTLQLLEMYDLKEYMGLSQACVRGDLHDLEVNIEKHMDYFISLGVFIAVESLRLIALRNFVRRVAHAVKETPQLSGGNVKQLNLKLVFRPLQKDWDHELDMDELECLLANLIG